MFYSNLQFYFQYSHNLLHSALTKFQPEQLDTWVLHREWHRKTWPHISDCESYRELKCGRITLFGWRIKALVISAITAEAFQSHQAKIHMLHLDLSNRKLKSQELTRFSITAELVPLVSLNWDFSQKKNVFRANKHKFRISMVPCSFILPSSRQAKYRCCTLKTDTHTHTAHQFLQAEGLLPSTAPVWST